MANHSYGRARWKRREGQATPENRWATAGVDFCVLLLHKPNTTGLKVSKIQRNLERSVHGCMSEASRKYRRQWRHAGHEICRLHLLGDDHAEELDPQPRRLGVMWDIW